MLALGEGVIMGTKSVRDAGLLLSGSGALPKRDVWGKALNMKKLVTKVITKKRGIRHNVG